MANKKDIVLATQNQHKLREITTILADLPVGVLSLLDFPDITEIEETGDTLEANALLKARTVFQHTGLLTLSDDTGLEVDVLRDAPGVHSARYAGEDKNPSRNNRKLLAELSGVPDHERGAQFRCVVAIVGENFEKVVEGIVRGRIIHEPRGSAGFGYDPLFMPDGYRKTFSELGDTIKNQISHRARAFLHAKSVIRNLI